MTQAAIHHDREAHAIDPGPMGPTDARRGGPWDYSAIIPAHNEAGGIAGAIASARGQSLPPREIIVVDDGSTDRTWAAARAEPGVRVMRHSHCLGPSVARNSGIYASTSAWVALLDADDRWRPDKIRRQMDLARSSGAGLVYCGASVVVGGQTVGEETATTGLSHRRLRRRLLMGNCIVGSGSAVLVQRRLIDHVGGFDESLDRAEDWDLWLRLSQHTRFAAVPEPLVILNKRPDSQGSDPQKMFRAEQGVLDKNRALFRQHLSLWLVGRRSHAAMFRRRAVSHYLAGRLELARRDLAISVRLWPFSLRTVAPLLKLSIGNE